MWGDGGGEWGDKGWLGQRRHLRVIRPVFLSTYRLMTIDRVHTHIYTHTLVLPDSPLEFKNKVLVKPLSSDSWEPALCSTCMSLAWITGLDALLATSDLQGWSWAEDGVGLGVSEWLFRLAPLSPLLNYTNVRWESSLCCDVYHWLLQQGLTRDEDLLSSQFVYI